MSCRRAMGLTSWTHLGAADKRLIWLENSYHVATLDNDKELIAAEMVAFIRARA